MKKIIFLLSTVLFSLGISFAHTSKEATKNVVEVVASSKDHSTLVAAVKAADLVTTLSGTGPFTVFAPTNDAFKKLPKGTLESLLKPESKDKLTSILTYHVVAGNVDAATLLATIKNNGGKATLTTVNGATLTATVENGKVVLTDAQGGKAVVEKTDLHASNGVVHVINAVLLP
ncbi:MAG: fasciclin domain-containing protein [Phycisphaerales bacterium]|nr:fasciclin domain-containing protein [Phycisphaerales bacterium]